MLNTRSHSHGSSSREQFGRQVLWRNLLEQQRERVAQALARGDRVGAEARAARILDVLLAFEHVEQRVRQDAARTPQINLEHQRVAARVGFEQVSSGVFETTPPSQ